MNSRKLPIDDKKDLQYNEAPFLSRVGRFPIKERISETLYVYVFV